MSLLSRRELRVALCPDKAIVLALSNGFSRKVLAQEIIPLTPGSNSNWQPALQALEYWLSENDLGKAEIRVQLSNCFTRFAMMPFDEGVSRQAERQTVAGLLLEGIYGEAAKQWRWALDAARFGEPCMVAAIDSELAEALEHIADTRKLKIASIQPYAATVVNAFGNQVQSDDGLFAVVEHGQAVLFKIKEKKISSVRKILLGSTVDAPEIVSMLRREMLIGGLAGETEKIYLHVAGMPNFKLPAVAGLEIIELQFGDKAKRFGAGYEMVGLEEAK